MCAEERQISISDEGQRILSRVKGGHFRLRLHAEQRSQERGIFKEMVIHCAKTCFHWEWQDDHRTHLYLGFLVEDKPGGFTAVLLDEVLIVTVFKRKLTKWEKSLAKSRKL